METKNINRSGFGVLTGQHGGGDGVLTGQYIRVLCSLSSQYLLAVESVKID